MKLYVACLLGLCALIVGTGGAIAALGFYAGRNQVHSVAVARAILIRAPQAWVGRTLLVFGRLDGCPPAPAACPIWQPSIVDPTHISGGGALPVERVPSSSWLTTLRHVPVLGALAPAPPIAHWGAVATYQVQLERLHATQCLTGACDGNTDFDVLTCDARACYKAIVLEGDPWSGL